MGYDRWTHDDLAHVVYPIWYRKRSEEERVQAIRDGLVSMPLLNKLALMGDRTERLAALKSGYIADDALLATSAEEAAKDKNGEWVCRAAVAGLTDRATIEHLAQEGAHPVIRAAAAARVEDQQLLAAIAQRDPDSRVRRAALERLSADSDILACARSDRDINVRCAAMRLLTDQALLIELIGREDDHTVRGAALTNLTGQTALLHIAQADPSSSVRLAAARKLGDQETLIRFVEAEGDEELRAEATKELSNQAFLERIAQNEAESVLVRAAAVKNLTDPALIQKFAGTDAAYLLRQAAIENRHWDDQPLFSFIALHDSDDDIRDVAVQRVSDTETLEKIVMNEEEYDYIRHLALVRLPDEALARVANASFPSDDDYEEGDESIHKDAVACIKSDAVLERIALSSPHLIARETAAGRIQDQAALARIAAATGAHQGWLGLKRYGPIVRDDAGSVRAQAIQNMTDAAALERLALSDPDDRARLAALHRIQSQDILRKAALKDGHWLNRLEAAGRLTEPETLIKIAQTDTVDEVCLSALETGRITDTAALTAIFHERAKTKDYIDVDIAKAALRSITSQTALTRIALERMSSEEFYDEEYCEIAIRALSVVSVITLMSESAVSREVREAATMRLNRLLPPL